MKVEIWDIKSIIPYDKNPRNNAAAVKPVANSIKEFGFQQPIVVDKDGVIIVGHTRYKAAKSLHLKEVPVVVADELTPDQVKAYRIADNSTGEVAAWDLPLLSAELATIDLDMSQFGLNVELPEVDPEAFEDDYDVELPTEPICRPGDVWQLGNHRLVCGDSTDPRDVMALMDGTSADLLVTDPPYNVDYEGSNGKKIQNDSMGESQFRQFLLQAYANAYEVCRTGAAAYIFHADTEGEAFRAMFREAGWELHGCLIWVKNSLVLGRADYQYQHEPCLYGWKPGAGHYFINDRTNTTVIDEAKPEDLKKLSKSDLLNWAITAQEMLDKEPSTVLRFNKPAASKDHPTMKPVPLLGKLIKNSSKPGQIVLDLFGGSGSTLIACEQLHRSCRVMEMDPQYADVIIDRWEQFTGLEAKKIN